MDTTRHFLERVLPDTGYIYAAHLTKNKRFWHKAFEPGTFGDVGSYMVKQAEKQDVYIALGSFRQKEVEVPTPEGPKMRPRRKIDNIAGMKCLYVDLDVGADKPYASKEAALGGLLALVKGGKVPRPSMVVDSGGGIHVYWCLDEVAPLDKWAPVAHAFKAYLIQSGLGIDPTVTGDPARVLRAPETINHKHNRRVRLLKHDGPSISLEAVRALAGEAKLDRPSMMLPQGPGAANVDEFTSGVSERRKQPAFMAKIAERCPAMAEVAATRGAEQSEPYWMAMLHLASFCEDGEAMAQFMSSGHAGYSEAQTADKFQQRLAVDRDTIGPTTCAAFSSYSTACLGCQYAGHIKSPIVLGNASDLPLMPAGFTLSEGVLHRLVEEKNDEGELVTTQRRVCWFLIDNIEMVVEGGITQLAVEWRAKKQGSPRVTLFQLSDLADQRTFGRAAHSEGMSLQDTALKDYRVFMVAFSTLLQQHSDPVARQAPFGWSTHQGGPWFGLGDVGLVPGDREEPINTGRSRAIVNQYAATGTMEEWRSVSDFICAQGHAPLMAIYASSYAAPLMEFLGMSGVLVSAMSPGSGVGKSSAMELAASVWGHPVHTVHAVDDTPAMVSRKMSMTSGLPAYWDELRVKNDMHQLVKHVFRITQGKDKSRLNSDTSFNLGTAWSTMMLICSNTSLFDYVLRDGGGHAGFYRVLEFEVKPPPGGHPVNQMVSLFAKLRKNYGHAGRVYARHLVENHDLVRMAVKKVAEQVETDLQPESAERFWTGSIAAMLTGALLANRCGLTTFDTRRLKKFLYRAFHRLRKMKATDLAEELDEVSALSDFLSTSIGNTLISSVVRTAKGRPSPQDMPRIIKPPTRELTVQIGTEDNRCRLSARAFREYLTARGMPQSTTITVLKQRGILLDVGRATIGSGTIYSTPAAGYVFDLRPGTIDVDQIYTEVPDKE